MSTAETFERTEDSLPLRAEACDPLLPALRSEEELLAQGAMTVLALALDRKDVILNAYPLTEPARLALGLMS